MTKVHLSLLSCIAVDNIFTSLLTLALLETTSYLPNVHQDQPAHLCNLILVCIVVNLVSKTGSVQVDRQVNF